MTLKEAGRIYLDHEEKINGITKDLDTLYSIMREATFDPLRLTCTVNLNDIKNIIDHLEDYRKHLKNIMETEIPR